VSPQDKPADKGRHNAYFRRSPQPEPRPAQASRQPSRRPRIPSYTNNVNQQQGAPGGASGLAAKSG